ncbi:hypothetical protein BC834DRAFT_441990 [Gloeopeniophorella convolvens]|nr:hypothetical protein BC834DRAFT_441990 [Gloeopeniophorella convolvens]
MAALQEERTRFLTVESSLTPPPASLDGPSGSRGTLRPAFCIVPPPLVAPERTKYQAVSGRDLPTDFDYSFPLSHRPVIGEYRDGDTLWYYAEDADGIVHRFGSAAYAEAFPYAVSEYKHRRRIGDIPAFDPTGSNVHPDSRPKVVIRIPPARRTKAKSLSTRRSLSIESRSDEEWEGDLAEGNERDDDDDGDSSSAASPRPTRRTTRASGRQQSKLPFSPRKTRFRGRVPRSESIDASISEDVAPARRSGRVRKSYRENVADADFQDDDVDSESEGYASPAHISRSKPKPKLPKRGRASRAAYGHIRSVVDLEYDDLEYGPLSSHRDKCERCQRRPTHILLDEPTTKRARKGKAKRKRKDDSEEEIDDEDKVATLGGWVQCLKCPLAAHWRCLANTQRDEILKAVQGRDRTEWESKHGSKDKDNNPWIIPKRPGLESHQTTEFVCSMCSKGGICMGCKEVAIDPEFSAVAKGEGHADHAAPISGPSAVAGTDQAGLEKAQLTQDQSLANGNQGTYAPVASKELLFRCRLCKRLAHYAHLPTPAEAVKGKTDLQDLARYYQEGQEWSCADCASFVYRVEKILAWRPYPPDARQPELPSGEIFNPKMQLPREYLVKWQDRSYRRVQWVPHGWLASAHAGLLRHFLANGPKVELLEHAVREDQVANAASEGGIGGASKESEDPRPRPGVSPDGTMLAAAPDAERRIPPAWKTADRVLDVLMWFPRQQKSKGGKSKKPKNPRSSAESGQQDDEIQEQLLDVFRTGEQPAAEYTVSIDEWEDEKENLDIEDIDHVVWAFIKWDDLGYDEATWDAPPRQGEPGYPAFKAAFGRFLEARDVHIKIRSGAQLKAFEDRPEDGFRRRYALKQGAPLDLGQKSGLKLMPFQVDGFNWLCENWWNHQPCILADEMGLGKTVQIATFIGNIITKFDTAPALVVVPNSTITNWIREFTSWVPVIRVVPYYGEAKSREVIRRYELMHSTKTKGTIGAKFHVLVTTYDTINSKDFAVFKSVPRWEFLVVDEGQRLKNDKGLLFKKLNELKVAHRVIMTGTPLNNNIRELFNLMNFLDPNEWNDLEQLEKDHKELTEDLVKELHNRLRPYFLRRMKGQVLQLPPKNEVIVPVSLTPLQKEIYKSVLGKNVELLKSLALSYSGAKGSGKPKTSSMNNMLMDLRKCIQHPYLVSRDIEPKGLSPEEAHSRLVAGSTKLRLLQALLPKLKARGHRVLLFSQFVIALDVIEDFLVGEGLRYLRLDGNTKQSERQKGMDEFNRPDSDVFIYLLSTRAGGVGINLWSADTVIIFDPDFNPHQDLQAIARAHRYGQTKPCLVFKLMAKDTAEERIVQTGKKKLVLDHVIVQKMDDEEGGSDVHSILTYGAQALFDETAAPREITYSDQDLDQLIEKVETEEQKPEETTSEDNGHAFSFAKVWTAENNGLEDVDGQDLNTAGAVDSWAHTLEVIAKEQNQIRAAERTGRGVRRKAAMAAETQQKLDFLDTPVKENPQKRKRKTSKPESGESDAYVNRNASPSESSGDEAMGDEINQALDDLDLPHAKRSKVRQPLPGNHLSPPSPSAGRSTATPPVPPKAQRTPTPSQVQPKPATSQAPALCAMCGDVHVGTCGMTDSSENLVHYRRLLFTDQTGEPFEDRRDAIAMIDDTLKKRGQLHHIYNQPLRLIEERKVVSVPSRKSAKARAQAEQLARPTFRIPDYDPGPSTRVPARTPHMSSSNAGHGARASSHTGIPPVNLPSRSTSARGLRPPETPTPRSVPAKRPSSEVHDSVRKRQKTAYNPGCSICEGSSHYVKDCPVVRLGPKR